jgi:hypothetical protein
MKHIIALLSLLLIFSACEDVVELDLNNTDSRLVIDARVELTADGTTTTFVQLNRTAGFYVERNPIVEDATVYITDSNGQRFDVSYNGDGIYRTSMLSVIDGMDYTLTIEDGGNTYSSTEQLVRTVPLIEVEQLTVSGFGDDLLRLTAFYNDPVGMGDYYLFEYIDELNEQVDVTDDEFVDGNRAPTIFFLEDFAVGITANIKIKGINERCFNFYDTLLQQAGEGGGGGPFATQPAIVRGNIINTNAPERYPFGYFRISEVFELDYVIQEMN